MRRVGIVVAAALLLAGLVTGSASAGGGKKLVEGTVYDATCVTVCAPECPPPPHCGPVTQRGPHAVICAQKRIVCPLYSGAARICLPSSNCGANPIYSGEGSLVNVRKRGTATVIARLPIVEGHFQIRLAPGEYVFHPYMAEEQCWSAPPLTAKVTARLRGPVPVALSATNRCLVHADAK
jgi:hypothetical protein